MSDEPFPGPSNDPLPHDPAAKEGGEPWNAALASGGRLGPDDEQKSAAASAAGSLGRAGGLFLFAGSVAAAAAPETAGVSLVPAGFLWVVGLGTVAIAEYEAGIAIDPPRSDYTSIAFRPNDLSLPTQMTKEIPKNAQMVAQRVYHLAGFTSGMLDSIERAQGADLDGEKKWKARQAAAAQFAWEESSVLFKSLVPDLQELISLVGEDVLKQKLNQSDFKNMRKEFKSRLDKNLFLNMNMNAQVIDLVLKRFDATDFSRYESMTFKKAMIDSFRELENSIDTLLLRMSGK